jgi:hypothetical protein
VHGEDLHTLVRRAAARGRGPSLSMALFIVTQVAAGLHHAHDKKGADGAPLGTVHRDVSPSNVMVSFDGVVKIVDFGVAKAVARRVRTRSGSIKGKIGYLSPEQARGDLIDRRSDVFALGILLFELTTGTRLFDKEHDIAVLGRLLTWEPPLPSARRPDYPPDLEAIVVKALASAPEERYATAEELQLALEDFAREERLVLSAVALGRFVRDVIGERQDPTAPGAASPGPDRPPAVSGSSAAGSAETASGSRTLSGAATRPSLPIERGLPRAIGIGAAVLLIAGVVVLVRGFGQDDGGAPATTGSQGAAATSLAASATSAASRPLASGTATSTARLPPAASGSAATTAPPATGTAPARSGSAGNWKRGNAGPATSGRPVIDQGKRDGDKQPGWNPGSVLPPVVDER